MADNMKLGIRAHDFGILPVEELAQKISSKGFSYVHLALSKAISDVDTGPGRLSPGLANHIGGIFDDKKIGIAVLGCYINPVHPDIGIRSGQMERFKEHIRFARDFGCGIVATETGSLNADYSYNEKNGSTKALDMLVNNLSVLVEEAEKFGVIVCIEGVRSHVVSTPDLLMEVLERIRSDNLQILFDPVNLISEENAVRQKSMFERSFDLFGNRIMAVHLKDFIEGDGGIITTDAGTGNLDYESLMELLRQNKPHVYMIIEDIKEDKMDYSMEFIRRFYR
jgi:L-ribulose-5-phosphate 3-epimerase